MKIKEIQPTPIQKLNKKLNDNQFYIKRDDLISFSFGGNKVRKAFLFFENLENINSDYIVTYGSSSSNHCRIIANIAASKKIPCIIISPHELSKNTFNKNMMDIFGAEIIQCPVTKVKITIDNTIRELQNKGFKPYFIQGGGHGNLGTQAYVDAYKEIIDFENELNIYFDYIFHTSGTGTTQAGLICGNLIHNNSKKIIGISNARNKNLGGKVVLESVNNYLKSIGKKSVSSDCVNFIDDYILDGYGSYNNDILQTIRDVLINEGIPLDTTYTGKAFWGMTEYIKEHNITGKNILFIHTGGTPLFFDNLGELIDE